MLNKDKIQEQYKGNQGKNYHKQVHLSSVTAEQWISNKRRVKLEPYINADASILEYGVGYGWNLRSLPNRIKVGFDLATHLSTEIEKSGISFVSDTSQLQDESFDIVICHHVLEHVSNPSEVLQEIKRLLKTNGKLLLFVPYEKEKIYHHYNPNEPNKHIFSWNVQTLGKLVELSELSVKKGFLRKFGYDLYASNLATKLKLNEKSFLFLQGLMQIIRPRKEVFILAFKQ